MCWLPPKNETRCLRMEQCTKEAKGSFVCVLFLVTSKPSLEAPQGTFLHTPSLRFESQTLSSICLWGVEWRYQKQNGLVISENGCFQVHMTTKPLWRGPKKETNMNILQKKLTCCTLIPTGRTVVSHHIEHVQKCLLLDTPHTKKHG